MFERLAVARDAHRNGQVQLAHRLGHVHAALPIARQYMPPFIWHRGRPSGSGRPTKYGYCRTTRQDDTSHIGGLWRSAAGRPTFSRTGMWGAVLSKARQV